MTYPVKELKAAAYLYLVYPGSLDLKDLRGQRERTKVFRFVEEDGMSEEEDRFWAHEATCDPLGYANALDNLKDLIISK